MSGLKYLYITTLKNKIKNIFKHPSRLILAVLFIFGFASVFIASFLNKNNETIIPRSITELYAIVFILYFMMFILNSINGLNSGSSFYTMADINLLFVSPISPKKVLLFGLLKQMEKSLFVGFFLLFQYSWLHESYNINLLEMLAIFFGYCLTLFCSQLVAMAIYAFTSSNETRKNVIKTIIVSATLILSAYVLLEAFSSDNLLAGIIKAFDNKLFLFVPISGWLKMFVVGVVSSSSFYVFLGLGLSFAAVLFFIIFIIKYNTDFYEDVLQSTEQTFSAITAAKEGKIRDASPSKIKLGKTGIGKGKGADVFFYKHLLENRRGRFFIIDLASAIFIAACLVYAFFLKDSGIIPIFTFATYMQIFNVSMGRWVKELVLPYVYMIPIKPFKKLIAICKESILKIFIEAIFLFVPMSFIINLSPSELISCIVARTGFGILLISCNILTERLFGTVVSKIMTLFLYFFTIILIALPGIILGVLLGMFFPYLLFSSITIGFLTTFIWNTAAGGFIMFMCRDILNYAELNNK